MKLLPTFLLAAGLGALPLQGHAALIIEISETNGNVRLDYSGTLDLSGITFNDATTALEEHRLRLITPTLGAPYNGVVNLYSSVVRTFTNAFSIAPGAYYTGNAVTASSFGGDAMLLPTASIATNATLRFDPLDFVGDVWSGSGFLQFDNTTIDTLGIDRASKLWVLNNLAADTITMNVVPEPGTAAFGLAGLGVLALRRRAGASRGRVAGKSAA